MKENLNVHFKTKSQTQINEPDFCFHSKLNYLIKPTKPDFSCVAL
jgi:hypothetical protein